MIEKILGAGLFICFFIRDVFGFYDFEQGIIIFGLALGILYLIANWWINKPTETTFRTIVITVLYGLTFSCLTFAILFKILFLTGADEMTTLGFMLIIVTLVADLASSIKKVRIINSRTVFRLLIFIPIVGILFLVSEEKRIKFTFRKNPDFINYYEANKDRYPTFYELQSDYSKQKN